MQQHSKMLWLSGVPAAVLLPFAWPWLSPIYGLILMALGMVVWGRAKLTLKHGAVFLGFLLWEVLSVFWSPYPSLGWADVVMVLPIALMGIIASQFRVPQGAEIAHRWSKVFAWSTIVAWSIIFFTSVLENGLVHYKSFALGGRVGVHFQSIYLIVAALILEREIWKAKGIFRWILATAVLWLLFGVITLSSRIHLIIVPVLIMVRFAALIWEMKAHRKTLIALASATVVVLGFLVVALPGPRNRMIDLRNEIRSIDQKVDGKQTNHRIFLWKYGVELVQESTWKGLGNGASEEFLHEKLKTCTATFYRGTTPYYLHEVKYDVHNIWLQSWLEGGVVGVLLLALLFGWGLYFSSGAVRYSWIVVLLSGTTESVLEKQAGVFILTFLVALTFVSGIKERREASIHKR